MRLTDFRKDIDKVHLYLDYIIQVYILIRKLGFNSNFARVYFKCDFYNAQVIVLNNNLDSEMHIFFSIRDLTPTDWIPWGWG